MSRKPFAASLGRLCAAALLSLATFSVATAQSARWRELIAAGDACFKRGEYACADEKYAAALEIAETELPLTDRRGADTLRRLGFAADRRARPDQAEDYHRQALSSYGFALGPDSGAALEQERILAAWYRDKGRLEDAVGRFRRVYEWTNANKGPDADSTASAAFEYAEVLNRLDRPEEALPLLEACLANKEKAHGAESEAAAKVLREVATARLASEQWTKAASELQRLVALETKLTGSDSEKARAAALRLAEAEAGVRRTQTKVPGADLPRPVRPVIQRPVAPPKPPAEAKPEEAKPAEAAPAAENAGAPAEAAAPAESAAPSATPAPAEEKPAEKPL